MLKRDWERLFKQAIISLREQSFVPFDTGHLKNEGIWGEWKDDNTFTIHIDSRIVDYIPYTQEPWHKGKNPNEGWVEKAHKYIASYLAMRLRSKR